MREKKIAQQRWHSREYVLLFSDEMTWAQDMFVLLFALQTAGPGDRKIRTRGSNQWNAPGWRKPQQSTQPIRPPTASLTTKAHRRSINYDHILSIIRLGQYWTLEQKPPVKNDEMNRHDQRAHHAVITYACCLLCRAIWLGTVDMYAKNII